MRTRALFAVSIIMGVLVAHAEATVSHSEPDRFRSLVDKGFTLDTRTSSIQKGCKSLVEGKAEEKPLQLQPEKPTDETFDLMMDAATGGKEHTPQKSVAVFEAAQDAGFDLFLNLRKFLSRTA